MTLYEIIKSLQTAQGSLAKQAILDANKENELFKAYMKATYDVGINYYHKKLPIRLSPGTQGIEFAYPYLDKISTRERSGQHAWADLQWLTRQLDEEANELMKLIIDRSIGAGVGDTMVLKTWPDLYFIPPYQRCSLMDEKAQERFSKIPEFYVQTKADGSFAYVVKRLDGSVDVITRQGSKYPQEFAERMAYALKPGNVLVGELLVYEKAHDEKILLARKTSNGILNSVLKEGELQAGMEVRMQAWDLLTQAEFEAGESTRPYGDRMQHLDYELSLMSAGNVDKISSWTVKSLAEADVIYKHHLKQGLEGCIAKSHEALWKDGTSKDMVKMKLKFEVEMRCTGVYEGTGKAKGMLGGINMESEDGLLKNDCGSGFSDDQRKHYWANPDEIVGHVVATEANDITQDRDTRKKPSLSLPIFIEVRNDKTVADTYAEIVAQLEAAKNGA